MSLKYLLKSKTGYSLVELMVVISVMGLVGLGTATLIKNVYEIQRKQESKGGLLEFSKNLQSILANDTNWNAIISHASNNIATINCLIDDKVGPFCATGTVVANFDVYTHDGTAAAPVLFYGPRSSATAGIDLSGAPCVGFLNAGAPLTCPVRVDLTLTTICVNGEATCAKPQVVIDANFRKTTGVTDPVLDKMDDRTAANGGSLSFTLRRGDNVRYEPFEIVQFSDTVGATTPIANPPFGNRPAAGGGGSCVANSWVTRPLSAPPLANVGNNMTLVGNTFRLQPGRYECTVSAEGYDQITGFKIAVSDTANATVFPIGSGITGDNSSTTVTGKIELNPVAVTDYRVQHYCTTVAADPDMPNTDFGRPLPDYTQQTVFTRVYCIRTL